MSYENCHDDMPLGVNLMSREGNSQTGHRMWRPYSFLGTWLTAQHIALRNDPVESYELSVRFLPMNVLSR